jgi:DNA-binding protein H-NS
MLTKNTRVTINNVMDARIRLLQKALEKPTVMVDARQKLTKQKDARERIQERRLRSSSHDVSNYTIFMKETAYFNSIICINIDLVY